MRFLPNGQWTLAKSDEGEWPAPTTLHGLIGKTHTVEVHPHVDHLLRLKNHIQTQPKQTMPIRDIKKSEFGHLADKLPRDAKGNVTPEMIDKHVKGLPKHKVEIKVAPYTMEAQQHRDDVPQYVVSVGLHPDTLKNMSPTERNTWDAIRSNQHSLKGHEHQVGWARIDPYKVGSPRELAPPDKHGRQIVTKEAKIAPNDKHWHIDEIQSDFGVPKRIDQDIENHIDPKSIKLQIHNAADITADPKLGPMWRGTGMPFAEDPELFAKTYPELAPHLENYKKSYKERQDAYKLLVAQLPDDRSGSKLTDTELHAAQKKYDDGVAAAKNKHAEDIKPFTDAMHQHAEKISKDRTSKMATGLKMHKLLSHGHEDPMHMVHSAINQLGRENGIESMSMDTPNHQAHQSGLRPIKSEAQGDDAREQVQRHIMDGNVDDEKAKELWDNYGQGAIANNNHDINFKSAYQKLGPEGIREWADLVPKDNSSWLFNGHQDDWDENLADNGSYDQNGEHTKRLREAGHKSYAVSDEVRNKLKNMTDSEKDALSRFANHYDRNVKSHLMANLGLDPSQDDDYDMHPDDAEYDLPVHQINTYDKRPKKLGFKTVDKKDVLGEHPNDQYNKVQYAKLAKKLRLIQELLRKA